VDEGWVETIAGEENPQTMASDPLGVFAMAKTEMAADDQMMISLLCLLKTLRLFVGLDAVSPTPVGLQLEHDPDLIPL
jgi:hypothetical protein